MRYLQMVMLTLVMASMLPLFALQAAEQKKVVLQLTDGSTEKQTLVLNVAASLVKKYGENASVEIVAFGPGLSLLFEENLNNERVQGLATHGVKFSACRNTYKKVNKMLTKEKPLNPQASLVQGGAIRIIELVEQGYILIRP